jgi:hypothetical protein
MTDDKYKAISKDSAEVRLFVICDLPFVILNISHFEKHPVCLVTVTNANPWW